MAKQSETKPVQPAKGVELNVKSTAARDLEERLANGNKANSILKGVNPSEQMDDSNDYVGTDPIYQNYANETEKPYPAESGAEADAEDMFLDAVSGVSQDPSDEVKEAYATISSGGVAVPAKVEMLSSTPEPVEVEDDKPADEKPADKSPASKAPAKS